MKCQNLFSGKKKKNIIKCNLLKILPREQSFETLSKRADDIQKLNLLFFRESKT